jgi:hypothetical protein
LCYMLHTSHVILLDLIIIFYEHKSSSSGNFLQTPVTSSLIDIYSLFSALFLNTRSPCSSPKVRDEVAWPSNSNITLLHFYSLHFQISNEKIYDSELNGSKQSPNLICS